MKLFLLRWLISWATLAQGLVGILTLGCVRPRWVLLVTKVYSRHMCKVRWGRVDEANAKMRREFDDRQREKHNE